MSWFDVLKVSDENFAQAVETVFSEAEDNDAAEKILVRLYGEEIIRPFIIAFNIKEREKKGHGKVIEGGASKPYMRSRGKRE